ncbi:DNA translocase FtsK 4TM domain-containing protein [Roseibacterium sp. SDUM158016]|uniref:DNA translocase FtsK n=1 Tax=Roseicyclus sediminis TaxID=2980997 RepID=UPI0021D103E6|nr:DNA translocase FtsK [Roseibacterium sp. SDUM158016]MCU4652460.1 DNA translocase FtsK 4TM domain-containing protein [Roseibacterium sp. SDUM158016]
MAYQTRQRDPFLDEETHAILVRRGQELLGLALLALGVAFAALMLSYAPEDPNFMAATDAPAQNLLGRTGASVAAILMMIVGYGALVLPVACVIWGLRFLLHAGAERAVPRVFFLPIVLALASIYAASHVPPPGWTHSFGLGGLFGDTVLGAVLHALPVSAQAALKIIAAAAFLGGAAMLFHVVGVTSREFRAAMRFLVYGLVATGTMLMTMLRGAGTGAGHAAQRLQDARAERRAVRAEAAAASAAMARGPVLRRTPAHVDEDELFEDDMDEAGPVRRASGFFARLRGRQADPEMAVADLEPELPERGRRHLTDDIEAPDDAQIRARISDAIRSRVRRPDTIAAAAQRRLMAGAGAPGPMPLSPALRAEPPLTAGHALAQQPETDVEDWEDDVDDNIFAEDGVGEGAYARVQAQSVPRAELQRRVVQPATRKPAPSRRALADAQPSLPLNEPEPYEYPPLTLLTNPDTITRHHLSDEALEENARMLESVLDDYGVKGEIVSVRPGPVVTMYELEPAPGLKASRVIGLADDIARSMSALSARVSTVPGRSVIGIELPNQHREKVVLREILSSREFGDGTHRLPLALGKDIGGDPIVANLAKMPHLLIAGTTGSGKSVAINTMILSLLYKLTPEECRMIMIDPKMLELSVYDGIPHLLSPVVTDPKKAVVALKWVVGEMEERYRKMSKMGVRNIDGYNGRVAEAQRKGEMFKRTVQTGFDDDTGEPVFETEEFAPEKMPFIVVIVDEMADLMMVAGKEIEACIQRLAQMARASGIHIIMATQRPSVDVITGTIKANFPTRISFHVTSKVDSRTILGEMGAEQLLGMGDMLYMAGGAKITRVHGPFVSDEEVEEIVSHLKSFGPPDYAASVLDGPDEDKESDIDAVLGLNTGGNTTGEDALYDQAVAIVIKDRKCSTSYIQRKLGIGYNKAARLVEQMEEQGLVSQANHVGKREILVPEQE